MFEKGQEKSLICLNRLQHKVLGHSPTVILIIVICKYLYAVG